MIRSCCLLVTLVGCQQYGFEGASPVHCKDSVVETLWKLPFEAEYDDDGLFLYWTFDQKWPSHAGMSSWSEKFARLFVPHVLIEGNHRLGLTHSVILRGPSVWETIDLLARLSREQAVANSRDYLSSIGVTDIHVVDKPDGSSAIIEGAIVKGGKTIVWQITIYPNLKLYPAIDGEYTKIHYYITLYEAF